MLYLQAVPAASTSMAGKKVAKSTLDKETQALIQLIFDNDMFNDTMKKFDIGNYVDTPQSLYNTIVGVHSINRVS